jgi:hypothetical protein
LQLHRLFVVDAPDQCVAGSAKILAERNRVIGLLLRRREQAESDALKCNRRSPVVRVKVNSTGKMKARSSRVPITLPL